MEVSEAPGTLPPVVRLPGSLLTGQRAETENGATSVEKWKGGGVEERRSGGVGSEGAKERKSEGA